MTDRDRAARQVERMLDGPTPLEAARTEITALREQVAELKSGGYIDIVVGHNAALREQVAELERKLQAFKDSSEHEFQRAEKAEEQVATAETKAGELLRSEFLLREQVAELDVTVLDQADKITLLRAVAEAARGTALRNPRGIVADALKAAEEGGAL